MEKKKNSKNIRILEIPSTCTGCGACANICPEDAIIIDYDKEGFYYPEIDFDICTSCRICERFCHVLQKQPLNNELEFAGYMSWSLDEQIRKSSSSGGMFSMLANIVLENKGVVFGARYNYDEKRLEHANTDNFDLSEFRKSKYIESNTLDTFSEVKAFLNLGRDVLYCGTPCQISGLKQYLSKVDTTNLLLVDFICHGVPSNKHFSEYLDYIINKKNEGVKHVDFRPKNKNRPWGGSYIEILFNNNSILDEEHSENLYYTAFHQNTFLRMSCYTCKMVNEHQSDITLGDFWGVYKYKPEINDKKGISLTIINSVKGFNAFQKNKDKIVLEKLPLRAFEYAYERKEYEYDIQKRNTASALVEKKGYIRAMNILHGKSIMKFKLKKRLRTIVMSALKIFDIK